MCTFASGDVLRTVRSYTRDVTSRKYVVGEEDPVRVSVWGGISEDYRPLLVFIYDSLTVQLFVDNTMQRVVHPFL